MPLAVLVVMAWVMFGINIFATVATRKYQQMYVIHLVHDGHHPLDGLRLSSPATSPCCFTTGTNQANLNWMYVHNAVGLIFTPVGPGASRTTSSRRPIRRSTATSFP